MRLAVRVRASSVHPGRGIRFKKNGFGHKVDGQVGSKRPVGDFHNSRFERLLRLDQAKGITKFPLNSILSNLFGDVELEEIREKLRCKPHNN